MTFDNKSKVVMNSNLVREEARLPAVSSSVLFEIFPFIIVFGEDMVSLLLLLSSTLVLVVIQGEPKKGIMIFEPL